MSLPPPELMDQTRFPQYLHLRFTPNSGYGKVTTAAMLLSKKLWQEDITLLAHSFISFIVSSATFFLSRPPYSITGGSGEKKIGRAIEMRGKGRKEDTARGCQFALDKWYFFCTIPIKFFLPPLLGKNAGSAKELIFQYSVHTTLSNILFPQSNNLDKPPSPEKRALESYRKEGGDIKSEVEGNPPLYWNVERRAGRESEIEKLRFIIIIPLLPPPLLLPPYVRRSGGTGFPFCLFPIREMWVCVHADGEKNFFLPFSPKQKGGNVHRHRNSSLSPFVSERVTRCFPVSRTKLFFPYSASCLFK